MTAGERRHVLVTGAGGFIGHHLVRYLKRQGHWVRGVDLKLPEYGTTDADEFELLDLRRWADCLEATRGVDDVYALAADMGGMGFISQHHAEILHNNVLINTHTLEAARRNGATRYLYTSSACVYPEHRQTETQVVPLREEEAYPAAPQDAYGWEKLISERLCLHYREDYGLDTRIVRFHNIFGPLGTWNGGREKAPAALCRKIAVGQAHRETRDRDLGRRGTDPFVLLHRRLRRGAGTADGRRLRRTAQPRSGPDDHASTAWPTSSRTAPESP